MSTEAQRVVVIQDAFREVSSSAIRWAQHGLSLKPGDQVTLLGVLHQVNTPSTLSFMGAGKLLGYKSRVDSNSLFAANQKIIEEEVARKKDEYQNDAEIIQLSKQYEMHEIKLDIEVHAGPSPKIVALQAAKNLKATWVILDRQMKKDKKYFMEKLACGISRMKRDNSIEQLRGPKAVGLKKLPNDGSCSSQIRYDEMIPGIPEDEDLFSLELSPIKPPNLSKTTFGLEQGVDIGEGPPWNNYKRSTSFYKSTSSEHLMFTNTVSSSSMGSTEASSSSFNESKCSLLNLQEAENNINTESESLEKGSLNAISISQVIGRTEHNERGSQDQAKTKHSSTDEQEEPLTQGVTGQKPDEIIENSFCSVCKNRRPKIGLKREFSYAELQAATNGFSPKKFLSEGGFGSVYKGKLRDGLKIAVKQHKDASSQGEKEFKSEVHVLSMARHKNVVMLLGSCSEGSHRLLVYEFVCNGSLDQHLSKYNSHKPLKWEDRMKIALGAATGLNYLHEKDIIHRDMRPNNILITHDYEPLLGDFGLAKTQHEESDNSTEKRVVGTFGYVAPEYAESGKASTKTDVYSFGVVLLQLITGRTTIDKTLGGKSLVSWARPLLREKKYPDLIDPKIQDSHDVHQLFWMVRVAEKCLSEDPDERLSMGQVVKALQKVRNGETVCGIDESSPAHSDSVRSIPGSNGSQGDEGTIEQENLINTEVLSNSTISQMSGLFTSASSPQTFSSGPPSISTSSERSSSSSARSYKKKRVKSQSKLQVFYGEMLS